MADVAVTGWPDLRVVGERVEELLAQVSAASTPAVARQAEELVGLLVDFHGAGLARVVDLVGERTTRVLAGDPLVRDQLELHGLHPAGAEPAGQPDTHELGARMEELLAALTGGDPAFGDPGSGEPAVAEAVEELVALLVDFYGAGMAGVLDVVDGPTVATLAADPLVAGQLILHGLHPLDTEERVRAALERVRPYLGSHAGDVHYRGISADGVVRLALAGSCDGCPSSAVTVKLAIEKAIEEAAPEIVGVEVAGMVPPAPPGEAGRRLLPLTPVGAPAAPVAATAGPAPAEPRQPAAQVSVEATWVPLDGVAGLDPGGITAARIGRLSTVVCNVAGTLYAYADRCPGCGGGLAGGRLEDGLLGCAGCGRHYDVRLAGRGTDQTLHLDPLPLLADNGTVRVAVSTAGH